jgi:hypothetical protein
MRNVREGRRMTRKLYKRKKRTIQAISRKKIRRLPYKKNGCVASLRLSQRRKFVGEDLIPCVIIPSVARSLAESNIKEIASPWKLNKKGKKFSGKWLIRKKLKQRIFSDSGHVKRMSGRRSNDEKG